MNARKLVAMTVVGLSVLATRAQGQEIKVGLILPFTGVAAEIGLQNERGIEQYLKLNADKLKPYTFKIIKRDERDATGSYAKTVIQELVTQDKVDILLGWIYSPNAIATAPIVTAAKTPAIITNAATAHITNLSPLYVRVSGSMWHPAHSMGVAAAKQLGAKTAVIGYTDFPPGKDSLNAFKLAFEANGGKILDEIPLGGPGAVPDMTPFFQRAKDKKPDVFFVFVPSGDHSTAVVRTYGALGMKEAGIKLIGTGDITQDNKLQAMGDNAIGTITMQHYNSDLDNPLNKRFIESWKKDYGPNAIPDFVAVAGYDGMAAVVHVAQTLKGKITPEGAITALKGWTHDSPRGRITIDPETRDVVMTQYLSEIVKKDGRLTFKPLGQIEAVKDPCKALKFGPCADVPK